MEIKNFIEQIFSQAVALDQSGGLRNTIYANGREIFIMNYDHTVLLRFRLRAKESPFTSPISFKANDYDSKIFHQEGDRIIFTSGNDGYVKKKICGTTDLTPEQVKELFDEYLTDEEGVSVTLSDSVLELLDDSLSHIEFSGEEGGQLKLIQRNIYTGGIIEIEQKSLGFLNNHLEREITPVAIKTDDFKALFTFDKSLKFTFPTSEQSDYIVINTIDRGKRDMTGILACCLYDEIIEIKQANHGRKEQKIRWR